MKENNLLASVALFSQLYNNEKYTNITDILGEFIKGVVASENKWTVNSTELTKLLESVYDFKIPESVVRTTVKNRLKDIVTLKDGYYVFNNSILGDYEKMNGKYVSIMGKQNRIISQLISFVEFKEGTTLKDDEKKILLDNLNRYLLENGVNDKYSEYISAFIISNQATEDFTDNLNLIREGLILYQGIRYTSDINELGKWNTELTIFLSTEHLFNALGYNGILYEQIFDDLYVLVNEINASNRNKGGDKLIQLKYLEETKEEFEAFFQAAEYIFKGTLALDTSKPAMKAILANCKSPSDIKAKKVKFEMDLSRKGITIREFKTSIYQYQDYVVDSEDVLQNLKKQSESRGRYFDENLCRQFFKIFTKINYLRGGHSKSKFFENIGSIFITGNRFALHLAHNSKVKFQDEDIPFAKDIDYITSKFWFKLKKGFGNKASLPKAFSVVTKAQMIISAQLNQSVFQEYQRLQKRVKDGDLTLEEATAMSYELRQKPSVPEEVTIETIDNSLDFLTNDSHFEDLHREKEKKDYLLSETLKHNEDLKREIDRRDEIEKRKVEMEKEQLLKEKQTLYVENKLKDHKKQLNYDLLYFCYVFLITTIVVALGLVMKFSEIVNDFMMSLGNWQYLIWGLTIFIFVFEIIGRSFLFNKEKMKSGFRWVVLNSKRDQMHAFVNDKREEFQKDFEQLDKL